MGLRDGVSGLDFVWGFFYDLFHLSQIKSSYQQSTTLKRPFTTVWLACKGTLVFGYTVAHKKDAYANQLICYCAL